MNKKMKKAVLLAVGAFFLAGCLVTGTFVITLNIDDFYSNSSGGFESHGIDLTNEQIWKDHKDNIKNISDVRFRATIQNQSSDTATGQVYFSSDSTYTDPGAVTSADDAFLVFGGMTIPPGEEITVSFAESAGYRQNLKRALELIETGKFYMYVLTPEDVFSLHVYDVYILVVIEAGTST